MDSGEFILTFLGGILSGVFITVGGQLLNDFLKRIKMNVDPSFSTLTKTTTTHTILAGFGISIEQGKELNGAYVRCNGQRYPWYENGLPKNEMKLFVGEQPNWFFPYAILLDYITDLSTQKNVVGINKREEQSNHGILLTVQELNTHKNIFSKCYSMPKNTVAIKQKTRVCLFDVAITLIGEGIERKMNYKTSVNLSRIIVGKLENGVPSMDTVDCEFTLIQPS